MYQNFVFDLGGVVFDEKNGATMAPLMRACQNTAEFQMLQSNLLLGNLSLYNCCGMLGEKYPAHAQHLRQAITLDFYKQNLPVIPEALDIIKWLSNHTDCDVFVLSNATDTMRDYAMEILDMPRRGRGVFSCNEHLMKPDFRIFQTLLSRFHLNPADTIYFDDKLKNCLAAETLGISTVLVSSPAELTAFFENSEPL